jgi:hypothetical protein
MRATVDDEMPSGTSGTSGTRRATTGVAKGIFTADYDEWEPNWR